MTSLRNDDLDIDLNLSLSPSSSDENNPSIATSPVTGLLTIDNNTQNPVMRSETIEKPYLWASNKRAKVESLIHIRSQGIHTIRGDMKCSGCENLFHMEYELISSFLGVKKFIAENKSRMAFGRRAGETWMKPVLPDCNLCGGKNCVNPVKGDKKRKINWLFLLLGNMLGCCTLKELKYFCKHNNMKHRTGAKDRVLYQTYLLLCNQLQPNRLFNP